MAALLGALRIVCKGTNFIDSDKIRRKFGGGRGEGRINIIFSDKRAKIGSVDYNII